MPVVTVQPDGYQVPIAPGRTVLEGCYDAGYAFRVGCRRGGCGFCKVDLAKGTVSYAKTVAETVLNPADRKGGTCLSCRAIPAGDITIVLSAGQLRRANPYLPRINPAVPARDRQP